MQNETVNATVASLEDRLALDPSVRNALAILEIGPEIRMVLRTVLPKMSKYEQKCLIAVVGFRLLGGALPASPQLFKALPNLQNDHFENLGAAFQNLIETDVLSIEFNEDKTESVFQWPALEKMLLQQLDGMHGPRLVDLSGQRITD